MNARQVSASSDRPDWVEWQRWPLREAGQAGWLRAVGLVVLLAQVSVILVISLPLVAAVLLSLLLIITVLPYFLPRRYQASPDGLVIVRNFIHDRRSWKDFWAFQPDDDGYWLITVESRVGYQPLQYGRPFYLPYPLEPHTQQTLRTLLESQLKLTDQYPVL